MYYYLRGKYTFYDCKDNERVFTTRYYTWVVFSQPKITGEPT